jgi:hypothetical protein
MFFIFFIIIYWVRYTLSLPVSDQLVILSKLIGGIMTFCDILILFRYNRLKIWYFIHLHLIASNMGSCQVTLSFTFDYPIICKTLKIYWPHGQRLLAFSQFNLKHFDIHSRHCYCKNNLDDFQFWQI